MRLESVAMIFASVALSSGSQIIYRAVPDPSLCGEVQRIIFTGIMKECKCGL